MVPNGHVAIECVGLYRFAKPDTLPPMKQFVLQARSAPHSWPENPGWNLLLAHDSVKRRQKIPGGAS